MVLFADLEKMINKQNLSYTISENNIPISKNLIKLIKSKSFKKINMISNGDDYQVLFTASSYKNLESSKIFQKILVSK